MRDFVAAGGGYVGICAGANLASCDANYQGRSLRILPTRTLDTTPQYPGVRRLRGVGHATVTVTPTGGDVWGTAAAKLRALPFHNGPMITPLSTPLGTGGGSCDDDDGDEAAAACRAAAGVDPLLAGGVACLARYVSGVAASRFGRAAQRAGVLMRGRCAAAAALYGAGRVVALSPHPEKSTALHGFMVSSSVAWAAGRGAVRLDAAARPLASPLRAVAVLPHLLRGWLSRRAAVPLAAARAAAAALLCQQHHCQQHHCVGARRLKAVRVYATLHHGAYLAACAVYGRRARAARHHDAAATARGRRRWVWCDVRGAHPAAQWRAAPAPRAAASAAAPAVTCAAQLRQLQRWARRRGSPPGHAAD